MSALGAPVSQMPLAPMLQACAPRDFVAPRSIYVCQSPFQSVFAMLASHYTNKHLKPHWHYLRLRHTLTQYGRLYQVSRSALSQTASACTQFLDHRAHRDFPFPLGGLRPRTQHSTQFMKLCARGHSVTLLRSLIVCFFCELNRVHHRVHVDHTKLTVTLNFTETTLCSLLWH